MPNWTRYLDSALEEANRWLTIRELRDIIFRRTPSRPSAVTIKNLLVERLIGRRVVGMLGRAGATYWLKMTNLGNHSSGPLLSRQFTVRRQQMTFNRSVRDAILAGTPLPNPFGVNGASHGEPRQSTPPFSGGIRTEELRVSRRLMEPPGRTMSDFIASLDRLPFRGRSVLQSIDRTLWGYLDAQEVADAIVEALRAQAVKAKERRDREPQDLETDFYIRQGLE